MQESASALLTIYIFGVNLFTLTPSPATWYLKMLGVEPVHVCAAMLTQVWANDLVLSVIFKRVYRWHQNNETLCSDTVFVTNDAPLWRIHGSFSEMKGE